MNPLTSLPPKVRLWAYMILGLAALVVAGLKAADGDWLEFAGYVLGGLGFGTSASNVPSYRDVVEGDAPPPIDGVDNYVRGTPDDRGAITIERAVVIFILVVLALVVLSWAFARI
jgi:hypothetical protein